MSVELGRFESLLTLQYSSGSAMIFFTSSSFWVTFDELGTTASKRLGAWSVKNSRDKVGTSWSPVRVPRSLLSVM